MFRISPSPTRRVRRLIGLGVVLFGLIASTTLVWHSSRSSFSSATADAANNFSAGTVTLTDDDRDSALFSATGLKPGSNGVQCIVVTSTGSLASAVRLYGAAAGTTNGLAGYLNLTVNLGTGGAYGDCSGFTPSGPAVYVGTLAAFAGTSTNYLTGLGSWAPTGSGPETRTYQFSYALDAATPATAQRGTATVEFTWEAQNT